MNDVFNTKILCDKCNEQTRKFPLEQEGFKLRALECPNCRKQWVHPGDIKDFQNFKELQKRQFDVKLRMVGNSFSVTIPKEIINFEERFISMEREMNQMMRLSLERPGKIILRFREL
ncbi:MAG: hypothetical protein ABIH25_04480 [Candidatus Woesearchaeota archaeon]